MRQLKRMALMALASLVTATAIAQPLPPDEFLTRFGLTPAQTRMVLERLDTADQEINELSKRNGLQRKTLRAIALELGARKPDLPLEQYLAAVRALASEAKSANRRIAELDELVGRLDPGGERQRAQAEVRSADQAFQSGRLAEAEAHLERLALLRQVESDAAQVAAFKAMDLQADYAALRGDVETADRVLSNKTRLVRQRRLAAEREEWLTELSRAEKWFERGDRLGLNDDLRKAIDILRTNALTLATRERVPLQWAATQNNLGNALQTLGERESGTASLEEATHAFRLALAEFTRERGPQQWAMTQNNLGAALQQLGERESGTARLEEAVQAYRLALSERTRDRTPLQWAATQDNLGGALQILGERESGTARLEEAVQAYRLALSERTRDRAPSDWATTQNNLGTALRTCERTSSLRR